MLDGTVTGPVENGGKIVDSDGKRHIGEQLAAERGIPACDVITMGDGWNDVKMLEYAGLGIAKHAPGSAPSFRIRSTASDLTRHLTGLRTVRIGPSAPGSKILSKRGPNASLTEEEAEHL